MSSSVFLGTRILKKWKYFYSKGFCSLCFICLTPNDSNSGTTCQIFFPRFRWQKSINWIGIFKTLNIISFHIWARKSLDVRPARFLQCQLSRMFRFSVKGKQRVQFVSDIHIDSAATNYQMKCVWGLLSMIMEDLNLSIDLKFLWHMLCYIFISWSSNN